MTLLNYQFDLEGYQFGHGLPVFCDAEGFNAGDSEPSNQDQVSAASGARWFGRDRLTPPDWTWSGYASARDEDGADVDVRVMQILDDFAEAWLGRLNELKEGKVLTLRYAVGGRERVVFGRPRRAAWSMTNRILNGLVPISFTFARADALHYAAEESVVESRMDPAVPEGFGAPFEMPLYIERFSQNVAPAPVIVGGTARTGLVVEFHGPIVNPSLTVGGVKLALTGEVGVGGVVTVDTRPWAYSITKSGDTSNVALARTVWLSEISLKPGSYTAALGGIDGTGSSKARVRWRDAWHAI